MAHGPSFTNSCFRTALSNGNLMQIIYVILNCLAAIFLKKQKKCALNSNRFYLIKKYKRYSYSTWNQNRNINDYLTFKIFEI